MGFVFWGGLRVYDLRCMYGGAKLDSYEGPE